MAKGKKSKKTEDSAEESDVGSAEEEPVVENKGKKDKKKKKDVEDVQQDLEDLNLDDAKPDKKSKKKAKKAVNSDSEEEVEVKKGGFSLLMADDLPSDDDDEDEPEEEIKKPVVIEKKKEKKDGKKKKKKKKDEDEDDDLDAMLAALRAEYNDEAPPETETGAAKGGVDEGKKKKKGKKDTAEAEEAGFEVIEDEEDEGGTVKTAAQKKKEKKDKQKQKLAEEKKAAAGKKKEPVKKQDSVGQEDQKEEEKEATPEGDSKGGEDGEAEGEGEADDKDGKKGKKKKGKKEEEEKKKKKPNKAVLAAMQEVLQKQKEEEERLQQEQEEADRLADQREQERAEQKKKDDEKKAAKKERERAKKAELKAQGKLLTPAQKLAKQRAEAMLEAMRAQGMEVPEAGAAVKRPRPGFKPRKKAQKPAEPVPEEPPEKVEEPVVEEKKEEEPDSWEEDIKDSWDAEEEEKQEVVEEEKSAEESVEAAEEGDEEEDDDDDEDEESESESEEDDESDEDSEEDLAETEKRRRRALERIHKRKTENEKNRTVDCLRAPVVCVLGHVDTGKTKILDKLRRTNVQDGEAGGITQQIGATNVPIAVIQEQCKMVPEFSKNPLRLPGLLIIDTPGHESFSNLRDRGSSLCDIAILVVDIMHGLEPQTIESLNLLRKKKTPFVVALNKVDRLYEWKANKHKDVREVLENQPHNTQMEFRKRKDEVILGLAEQGMNAALFWENPDPEDYISLIPTSAHSGDGMGNLMALLVQMSQSFLAKRLSYTDELQATVLEVKAIGGFGTTIDVILVNGRLKFGQTLILAGTEGPIVTTVKALLTPAKMQDLRVKNSYIEHKDLQAAQGVKIAAKELEKVIAGLSVRVALNPDEVEILKAEAENDLKNALNAIKLKDRGVFVQASTLGSLEALLEFLKQSKIPYAGVRIGPVVRRDVMRASTMLEHSEKYAVILAFDVKVERDAQEMADREGVRIFQADIIYHLFDRFTEYQAELVRKKKEEFRSIAVFPCKLRIMKEHIYMSRDPIVCGVKVESGTVKVGTPICVPSKEFCFVGICSGIQHNSKDVESARKGDEVCVKIDALPGEAPKMFGRHFDDTDLLISKISRESIDACKNYFRDDLTKTDWMLMVELKKLFEIL